jgi:D-aspartate ligase
MLGLQEDAASARSSSSDLAADATTPVCVLNLRPPGALGLVRSLGRLGAPVYGVHGGAPAPASHSRFIRHVLPLDISDAPADAVERLLEFAAGLGDRPVLITNDDLSALFLEDHADALRERFIFPEQHPRLAHELYSKKGMYLLCKRLGVATAEANFPQTRADVVRFIESNPLFPVVLKPIAAWRLNRVGGRMLIAGSGDELLAGYDRLEDPAEPNLMLQEYIPGGADSAWIFNGYFNASSRCLVASTGRKLRDYPAETGMTSLGVCSRNDEVERLSVDFLTGIGYRGAVDLDWRYDGRDRQYKLLDVNPRLGNAFRLFVARNGLDVARALYLDLTGQPVPPVEFPEGRKWLVENFDVGASVAYLRARRLTLRGWIRELRGIEETAWWASDDPLPFVFMCARSGRAALRKLLRAIGRRGGLGVAVAVVAAGIGVQRIASGASLPTPRYTPQHRRAERQASGRIESRIAVRSTGEIPTTTISSVA